ncbi:MAG: hypothetical protein ACREFY_08450 [Acetobacteraceae bacterium]
MTDASRVGAGMIRDDITRDSVAGEAAVRSVVLLCGARRVSGAV